MQYQQFRIPSHGGCRADVCFEAGGTEVFSNIVTTDDNTDTKKCVRTNSKICFYKKHETY